MRIASAISELSPPARMAEHLAMQLEASHAHPVDLLVVSITQQLQEHFLEILGNLRTSLRPRHLLAMTAESVIGGDQELERVPAASAMVMQLPGVKINTFHLTDDDWDEVLADDDALRKRLDADDVRAFLMAADPFTTPVVQMLDSCSRLFPQAPIIGGMASGMSQAGEARLAADDHIHSTGLVGVSISGPIQVDCIVSQGCRSIGPTFTVTKGNRNVVEELNGKPALAAIEEMVNALPNRDR